MIYKSELFQGFGLQGLNKGMFATMLRNGSFNSIYFGFYHSVKGIIPEQEVDIKSMTITCKHRSKL